MASASGREQTAQRGSYISIKISFWPKPQSLRAAVLSSEGLAERDGEKPQEGIPMRKIKKQRCLTIKEVNRLQDVQLVIPELESWFTREQLMTGEYEERLMI
jgi:hypothetical protein